MDNPITLGMIKADIATARSALANIADGKLNDYGKGLRGIAAYHAQQALEKLIKYKIYDTEKYVDNRQIYTHDIDNLCALAISLGVTIPREIQLNASMYSEWEASGRYDLHFVARKDSINKAIRLAEEFLQTIE
ncbi:MAG: HEPN domain-containing protein [Lachnospiraceae bacterium]|nr:HEPN domain-containing protein [Lachnospiraceae bacterium]